MKIPFSTLGRAAALVLAVLCMAAPVPSAAGTADHFSTAPAKRLEGKWRIGYYEGGPYVTYVETLEATIRGLMNTGWIEPATLPARDGESSAALWTWLATKARSEFLEFVPDAHYSANWEDDKRRKTSEALIERLASTKDLDLVMAMGTWAGKDLANDRHGTPTIVMATSDPLSSGIIRSVEDSGFAHVHARVDPDRYKRQLTVFHEIVRFKKLGVAYEDSVDGRVYAAIDDVEELAKARGFEVVRCHTKSDIADTSEAERSVLKCIEQLAKTSDAIYVTNQGGVTARSVPSIVRIANEHLVPTFSQTGSQQVQQGMMVSLATAGRRFVGQFSADVIAKVFNGARPNQLNQLFEAPPKIAINLRSAELVGFNPPVVLLGAADEIFSTIPSAD